MASFTMRNQEVEVVIDEYASEIHSFKDLSTGMEYMWQGDPAYWKGRNPSLFPLVGTTWDKILHIGGKDYTLKQQHCFLRRSTFTCTKHTDTQIVMEFHDTEETKEEFPFAFNVAILYELKGRRLSITYSIRNDSDDVMPFGFGLHPAFNCPIDPAKSYEDYWLEFSNPETFDWKTTSLHNEKVLSIQDRDALANTIIVHEPVSSEASLTDGTHSVTVSCVGYEWLAFWSPRAPFVCIEPWHSHTDFEEVRVPFEKREGTILLDPHRTFTTAYTITVK